jgi:uncharacterized lipoprotein YddW (UPF0748 family)
VNACLLFALFSLPMAAVEEPIDAFSYPDTAAARKAWVAGEGTPPVEVVREGERSLVQFAVPFASKPKQERTIIDRKVSLDLAAAGQFTLDLAVDRPEAAGQLSLYFRSGDGWYSAGQGLRRAGWHTLHFSKAAFGVEGHPAGWQQIDGIRISIWRGQAHDGHCRLGKLAALRHDVALVIPAAQGHRGDPELHGALQTAEQVGEMLSELGLGSDAVEDAALEHGALGSRRVAILAHNPRLDGSALAALEKFVAGGGKLLVCYSLPGRLGALLGFENPKYIARKKPAQFAEIRFEAADVPGLPKSVGQASWNITTAEPAGHGARVIARWFDADGRPTGLPAMLLSDRGAFLTHIILPDDRPGKKQMLSAVLGRLAPPLWEQMARAQIERIGAIGHLGPRADVAAFVQQTGNAKAVDLAAKAAAVRQKALDQLKETLYPETIDGARRARDLLAEAYLRAQSSPKVEGRAIWNHSGTGAYEGDWERTAKELETAGFNMVVPNMLWGGLAHYASDLLPRSKTFQQHGDQIAQCVAACRRHGIEVHVWKVNYNLSTAPKEFVRKMHEAGRTQVSSAGQQHDWLCPSHPENFKLELESMLEVARKYPVAGLHFDYIRYPDGDHCYCQGCRERFEAQRGAKVAHWPKDCSGGPLRDEYRTWRCRQITRLVEAVHREGKKLRPELAISAAVFGSYPSCRESVGQDWPEWIKAGLLDFVCPMDYTQSDLEFENLVTNQLRLTAGRIPVYPGIGAWRLSPDRMVGQIHHARRLGAPGFTIFNLDPGAIQSHVPAVGLGAGAQRATPPHGK